MIYKLVGGPCDGANVEVDHWVEALVIRDRKGKLHRYLHTGAPMGIADGPEDHLDHESDRSSDKALGGQNPTGVPAEMITQANVDARLREIFNITPDNRRG